MSSRVDTWCPRLTNGYRFSSYQQQLWFSPCCFIPSVPVIDANQIKRQRYQLRIQAKNDPHSVCNTCVRKEAADKYSMRQAYQDFFNHNTADSLVIDIGSDIRCNAACIMCGPHLSTFWQQEFGKKVLFTEATANKFVEQIATLVDLNKVKRFNFVGGEPLLASTHKEIIRKITDLSDVELHYNTNGSIFPDEETLDLWSKTKKTNVIFSIDGIESQFEFIRYPLRWLTVSANIEKLLNYLLQKKFIGSARVHVTCNPLNAFYIDTVENYFENLASRMKIPVGIIYDFSIDKFDLKATPPRLREMIFEKYTLQHQISKFLEQSPFDVNLYQEMTRDLSWIHQKRNLVWQTVFPDIVQGFYHESTV